MVYLVLGILLLLLYVFATPESIKGTVNIVAMVCILVALLILLVLSFLKIFQLPTEIFLAIAMLILAYFSVRDITCVNKSLTKQSVRKLTRRKNQLNKS
ncbi:membrane protein [Streptococcus pneumoniae]|nr:membrane protein [Streptococcus pneumoniae]VRO31551.1 membrane protein [Streptococcus pneumoniae]VRO85503.1 membrane protein [Streptococcus pneumoniae]